MGQAPGPDVVRRPQAPLGLPGLRGAAEEVEAAVTFLLNPKSKIAHVAPTIERCNGDQMASRWPSEYLAVGYRLCKWCEGRLLDVAAERLT